MEIKRADGAELVDARDLKSPGATEIAHLSDLTPAGNPHEAGGDPAVLSNTPPPLRAVGLDCAPWRISHQRRYFVFINRLRESASARENTLISSSARVSTSAP